jgi:L-malate glycosyltransferase
VNAIVANAQDHLSTRAAAAPRSIVLVGPLPPPSGGMANQTRQLAQLLASDGCKVTTVQVNAPYRPAWVARVRGVRALFRLMPFVRRLWTATRGAELVHVMANSGWAWHLFAAPAVWIAWLRRVPVVVNYRGGDADAFLATQSRLIRPTLARAGIVIVPSGFLNAVFAKYGVATSIVPNIVNLDAFRPADALPTAPHLLVTRNLEPIYDIATVIRAFAILAGRYADAQLTVAGSGPDRDMLERTAAELGVARRVRFTGRLDNAQLPSFYRAASVVVNASLVDNLPISLLEAMASGVPIATTNVGGIRYVVEHEVTALLVPPGDPVAMADAVLRLLEDRPLALRLRAAGVHAAQRYAWPKVRGELFEGYALALRHRRLNLPDAAGPAPR